MKKIISILFVLVFTVSYTNAQNFFKRLLDSARTTIEGSGKQLAENLKKTANQAMDEVSDSLQSKYKSVNQMSNKLQSSTDNSLQDFSPISILYNNSGKSTVSTNNIVAPTTIESALKRDYPIFYNAYNDIKLNDPKVKTIIFGISEHHKFVCSSNYRTGTIKFDISYFETNSISEDRAIFDLYQMDGYINYVKGKNIDENVDVPTEKHRQAYEYTLIKILEKVNKFGCGPLRYTIKVLSKRNLNEESGIDDKNSKRNIAAKIVANEKCFRDAVIYLNGKCN